MDLLIDIGNTRIKTALVEDDDLVRVGCIEREDFRQPDQLRAWLRGFADKTRIRRIGIASVVPQVKDSLIGALPGSDSGAPFITDGSVRLPFTLDYETPQTLGADRIASAAAAWTHFGEPAGRPIISVDAGTATTYEVVSRNAVFRGGAIAPGPVAMARALGLATAQLPQVEIDPEVPPIGRSTSRAMQSGVFFGYIDAVEGMLRRIIAALDGQPIIVLTGGWSSVLHSHITLEHERDPDLVLRGINVLMRLSE